MNDAFVIYNTFNKYIKKIMLRLQNLKAHILIAATFIFYRMLRTWRYFLFMLHVCMYMYIKLHCISN